MPISKEMNLLRMISGGSILLWCLVVLGIGLRFYILDKKDFWMDETLTLLHVSGYNESDFRKGLITGRPIQFREVARFQKPNPEKGPAEVLSSLACSQPEHSPLFYLCAYFWARAFSAQAATMKCLPVLFSILQLPCLYWLSVELFSRRLSAELSVALMALSPL